MSHPTFPSPWQGSDPRFGSHVPIRGIGTEDRDGGCRRRACGRCGQAKPVQGLWATGAEDHDVRPATIRPRRPWPGSVHKPPVACGKTVGCPSSSPRCSVKSHPAASPRCGSAAGSWAPRRLALRSRSAGGRLARPRLLRRWPWRSEGWSSRRAPRPQAPLARGGDEHHGPHRSAGRSGTALLRARHCPTAARLDRRRARSAPVHQPLPRSRRTPAPAHRAALARSPPPPRARAAARGAPCAAPPLRHASVVGHAVSRRVVPAGHATTKTMARTRHGVATDSGPRHGARRRCGVGNPSCSADDRGLVEGGTPLTTTALNRDRPPGRIVPVRTRDRQRIPLSDPTIRAVVPL